MKNVIRPVKKISVQATLLSIGVGKTYFIETKQIKASSIRSAIRTLKDKGFVFESTERDLVNQVKVTRLK